MSCDLAGKIVERRKISGYKEGMASGGCGPNAQTESITIVRKYGREGYSLGITARQEKAGYGHSFRFKLHPVIGNNTH